MHPLKSLLTSHEDWLMARVLHYAKRQGYTRYTSTLEEAWRISISGLTKSIVTTLDLSDSPPELRPEDDFRQDPVAAFGMVEAVRHRERGVTLGMFLGLTKYYRQSYIDLVEEKISELAVRQHGHLFIERCFDRIELGYIIEWSGLSETEKTAELQNTNRRMTNEKNKYLTILESAKTPILLLDGEGRLDNWNVAAAKAFADSARPGEHYYSKDSPPLTTPWLQKTIQSFTESSESEVETEQTLETTKGARRYQIRAKQMLDVSDKFFGTVLILNDITEMKTAEMKIVSMNEKLTTLNKELEAFAYSVSHDLRAPLRAIAGYSQMLVEDFSPVLGKEGNRQLQVISGAVNEMGQLIDGLLTFSRLGRKPLKKESIDVSKMVESIWYQVKNSVPDREIVFELGDLPPIVGDHVTIHEVFSNLLQNAVKYTSPKPVAMISVTGRIEEGRSVFSVKDNGVGFDMKYHDKLFQVFQRLHRMDEFEGTGVGLALVQRIVTRHGGSVWAESAKNEGATFYVSIPTNGAKE